MKIKIFLAQGERVSSLLKEEERKEYICCKIDGAVHDLSYSIPKDGEYNIEFLDFTNQDSIRIYEASLRYLLALAIKTIDSKLDVRFFYNVSRSIFCRILGKKSFRVTPAFVEKIKKRMDELVLLDLPIERIRISKEDALAIYRQAGLHDKIDVLKYRPENFVHLFELSYKGQKYYDYLYSPLVPSTGYLKRFSLRYYEPGIMMQFPRAECGGKIPPFSDELKFANTLAGSSRWAELNHLDTASSVNRFLKKYGAMAFVNLCEAKINMMLSDLAKKIVDSEDPVRLIGIAGPSSSGKTSFANRLTYQLMALGYRPIRISIDDFYVPKKLLPPGADLESIDTIDIPFFEETMSLLIQGEKVRLPSYSFKDGVRSPGKEIALAENQPIIIEGIHALNRRLTENIPEHQMFKVYIAPQPQVNLDNHTPLSMTDLRLIRRITRDARTRGSDAKETISMWPGVRNGEFRYIYPTQENADFVFDSFLAYETCAMRSIALPLLESISPSDQEYSTAQRLKNILKYFLPMPLSDIPCNSLIREFIGGSSFKDAR